MSNNNYSADEAVGAQGFIPVPGTNRMKMSLSGDGWMLDGAPVTLPHTWDDERAEDPSSPVVCKTACYSRSLPDQDPSRRWFLRFEGVSVKATVKVNGREAGRHAGAFTPFTFEISDALKATDNLLEVEVDNRFDPAVAPVAGDFTISGGIYRDVWLISAGRETVMNDGFFPDELARTAKPRAEFREDGFYVDGVKTVLRGVNYHQDGPAGWHLAPDQEEKDLLLIKEMGANAVRTSHYPRSEHFYDLCDRLGLFVWTEIPFVNCFANDPQSRANLLSTAREMVLAHRHHPSIICWGLFNELYESYMPDGTAEPVVKELNALVHELDPSRPTVAATDQLEKFELNAISDALGINIYPGWYWGKACDLGYHWDVHAGKNGRATCAVSEYGAGGCIDQHRNPAGERPEWDSRFHPEEYQAKFHHDAWNSICANPRLWGAFVWQMFDTRSPTRREGSRDGVNDKGLVTRDRRTPKDAFYFYKANWNPAPMLHLCGTRMTTSTGQYLEITGYSNIPGEVTLRLNGEIVSSIEPDSVKQVQWNEIELRPGPNTISISAGDLTEESIIEFRRT